MYSAANSYLNELGLGIDVETSDTTAGADYSDIV
jgi:hypothetical protein